MASDLGLSSSTGRAIPKLAPGGANYVSYKEKITEFLTGQPGFRKHLVGRAPAPVRPAELKAGATKTEQDMYNKLMDVFFDEEDEY
ncbi:hypothetical protein C8F04DRAFT_883099, partial [Mycena alexandri]